MAFPNAAGEVFSDSVPRDVWLVFELVVSLGMTRSEEGLLARLEFEDFAIGGNELCISDISFLSLFLETHVEWISLGQRGGGNLEGNIIAP